MHVCMYAHMCSCVCAHFRCYMFLFLVMLKKDQKYYHDSTTRLKTGWTGHVVFRYVVICNFAYRPLTVVGVPATPGRAVVNSANVYDLESLYVSTLQSTPVNVWYLSYNPDDLKKPNN